MIKALFPNARFVNTVRDRSIPAFRSTSSSSTAGSPMPRSGEHRASLSAVPPADGPLEAVVRRQHFRRGLRRVRGGSAADDGSLAAFPRLSWDDGCLSFQRLPNRVRTASVSQVREPLYRKSSGRWRNYARQLEPARPVAGRRMNMDKDVDLRIRRIFDSAARAFESGQAQQADQMLRQAEAEAPRHPLVLNESARRLLLAGDTAGAHVLLTRAVAENPSQLACGSASPRRCALSSVPTRSLQRSRECSRSSHETSARCCRRRRCRRTRATRAERRRPTVRPCKQSRAESSHRRDWLRHSSMPGKPLRLTTARSRYFWRSG